MRARGPLWWRPSQRAGLGALPCSPTTSIAGASSCAGTPSSRTGIRKLELAGGHGEPRILPLLLLLARTPAELPLLPVLLARTPAELGAVEEQIRRPPALPWLLPGGATELPCCAVAAAPPA
jgi:hypothetical protein